MLAILLGHVVGWVIFSSMVQAAIKQITGFRPKEKRKADMDGMDDSSSCTADKVRAREFYSRELLLFISMSLGGVGTFGRPASCHLPSCLANPR